jgi:hypothetical protein
MKYQYSLCFALYIKFVKMSIGLWLMQALDMEEAALPHLAMEEGGPVPLASAV